MGVFSRGGVVMAKDPKDIDTDQLSEQEILAQSIVQSLRVVVRSTQSHSRGIEKQCGVSAVQLWALWEIQKHLGIKVSELSRALSIHYSTASNMLDKLEEKGLIRRDRSGEDQRVVRLYITDAGDNLLARAPQPAQGAVSDALLRMNSQSLSALNDGLQSLIEHMEVLNNDAAMKPL